MNQFLERWSHAIKVRNGEVEPELPTSTTPSFEEWVNSEEHTVACELLKASNRRSVVIGHNYPNDVVLRFTPWGVYKGYGQGCSLLLSDTDAVFLAIKYNCAINSSEDLVVYLRRNLDMIAEGINQDVCTRRAA